MQAPDRDTRHVFPGPPRDPPKYSGHVAWRGELGAVLPLAKTSTPAAALKPQLFKHIPLPH